MTQLTDSVFVSIDGGRLERLRLHELLYVEAAEGAVQLTMRQRSYRLQTNLGTIEAQLPPHLFWRVSRQHIVNVACIEGYEAGLICLEGDHRLPLGPQYRQPLLAALPILRTKIPTQR